MTGPTFPESFLVPWKEALKAHEQEQQGDFPAPQNPATLVTTSFPRSIFTGTGAQIYTHALLPAIARAQHEIILVTCFWAQSETLTALRRALEELAERRRTLLQTDSAAGLPLLQVRIGFSSTSAFQKIFHTWSRDGHVYPPSKWPGLGLPDEETLREARIEMSVKSLFFLPFSVMHPKFVIIDRQRAWMPSCNVSWEAWFETCLEFSGEAVQTLLGFYKSTWAAKDALFDENPGWMKPQRVDGEVDHSLDYFDSPSAWWPANLATPPQNIHRFAASPAVPTILLPSSHHRNPRFRLFHPFRRLHPPTTPLNAAILTLITNAQHHIDILTPNFTCDAVQHALLSALSRGVSVTICTSRNMMIIEQIVTAGTTTAWCLRSLIRRYKGLGSQGSGPWPWGRRRGRQDMELSRIQPGQLKIYYYTPNRGAEPPGEPDPVLAHAKVVFVDGEFLVMGSGNMDRASWYTSQELGLLLYVPGLDPDVWFKPLRTRKDLIFPVH